MRLAIPEKVKTKTQGTALYKPIGRATTDVEIDPATAVPPQPHTHSLSHAFTRRHVFPLSPLTARAFTFLRRDTHSGIPALPTDYSQAGTLHWIRLGPRPPHTAKQSVVTHERRAASGHAASPTASP